jgi:hypothetical protein
MCKAICGVAAGACNSAINLHWAKGSDISDINAKFGAQHTVTGGLGLLFAALFARSVSSVSTWILWSLYASLTLLHIFANVRCVRLIAFDYLNTERMDLIVNDFLTKISHSHDNMVAKNLANQSIAVDDPTSLSQRESLFFKPFTLSTWKSIPIKMGLSFDDIAQILALTEDNEAIIRMFIEQIEREKYFVAAGKKGIIVVINQNANADPIVKAKAYFNACLMRQKLLGSKLCSEENVSIKVYEENTFQVNKLWPIFVHNLTRIGWDLNKTALSMKGFCITIEKEGSIA